MLRKRKVAGAAPVLVGALSLAGLVSWAAEEEGNPAELAKAPPDASVSLA